MIEVLNAAGVSLCVFGFLSFFLCFGALCEARTVWTYRIAYAGMLLSILLGATGLGLGVYAKSMRSSECALPEVSDD